MAGQLRLRLLWRAKPPCGCFGAASACPCGWLIAEQSCALPAPPFLPCSDGNLVATLMSHRMNVTQCNIAHALEKTK